MKSLKACRLLDSWPQNLKKPADYAVFRLRSLDLSSFQTGTQFFFSPKDDRPAGHVLKP